MVGRYLTIYLMGREPLHKRIAPLTSLACAIVVLCGISIGFPMLSPSYGQVAHALLTRPPLSQYMSHSEKFNSHCFVQLACVKHAASVRPEPGSNS